MTTEEPIKISSVLSEKAMIVRLAVSGWSGRITDKVVTAELNEIKNAAVDAAIVTKTLIDKNHLKIIRNIVSGMKKYHNEQTMPWDNNGGRLLPSTEFNAYTMKFRESQRALETAVTDFVLQYPGYISESEERLGALFSVDDYPAVTEIQDKFSIETNFEKVPEADDFRVDIPEHEQQKIREQIEGRIEARHADSMKRLWTRIFKAVEHINTKLSEDNGIFRDTLVENVEQLVEVLPALNILDDQALTDMTNELRETLCGYAPDDIRKNDVIRKELAEKSGEVLEKIAAVSNLFAADGPDLDADADPVVEIIDPPNTEES